MKTTLINRVRLAAASGMLVVAGAVGLTVPASALSADPCPPPVIGEDGQPVTFCNPGGVDTTAPVVSINNPESTTLKRNQLVLITALAQDIVGVVTTELYVDGELVASANGSTAGYGWTPTERGTYTITANAYDAAGNVGTASKTVTVK